MTKAPATDSPPSDPMTPEVWRVARARREIRNVSTLYVAPPDGLERPAGAPGQFNMMYVFGVGEAPISISGFQEADGTIAHTVRGVGAVTRAITGLKKGDPVGIRGPFGSSWPLDQAQGRDVVIVSGGIGLAPLRPVLRHVLDNRNDFGKVTLLYGARTPADVLYAGEIPRWRRRGVDVRITVDRAPGPWEGEVGVVTRLIPRAGFDPQNCIAMICGAEVMMRFTVTELHNMGVSDDQIFISMERNMKCAVSLCGHCQLGPYFICQDGPVFPYPRMRDWLWLKEV